MVRVQPDIQFYASYHSCNIESLGDVLMWSCGQIKTVCVCIKSEQLICSAVFVQIQKCQNIYMLKFVLCCSSERSSEFLTHFLWVWVQYACVPVSPQTPEVCTQSVKLKNPTTYFSTLLFFEIIAFTM